MEKKSPGLSFKLDGDRISSRAFKKGVDKFLGIVEDITQQFPDEKRPKWIVFVEPGCICLKLRPELPAPQIIAALGNGITQVSLRDDRPPYFSDNMLRNLGALTALSRPKDSGIKGVRISYNGQEVEMGKAIREHVNSIMKIQGEEYGSVEGTLKIVSAVPRLHFQIYEAVNDHSIACIIDDSMTRDALNAFDKKVCVFGLIHYMKGGIPKNIHVQELRVFKNEDELPSADEVLGILKSVN